MYTSDYSGFCPSLVNNAAYKTWMQELLPYVKNAGVFGCPSGNIHPQSSYDLGSDCYGCLTYGWNATLFNYAEKFPVRENDIFKSTRTVFLADSQGANWLSITNVVGDKENYIGLNWNTGGYATANNSKTMPKVMPKNACRPSNRHNGMINVSFCDGHTASMTLEELTKVQQFSGSPKVAYYDSSKDSGAWTTMGGSRVYYFPYFQVSASQPHF